MKIRIPLSEAALRLRLTYHQVRQKLFRGELPGGRDQFGNFYVDDDLGLVAPRDPDPTMASVGAPVEGDED